MFLNELTNQMINRHCTRKSLCVSREKESKVESKTTCPANQICHSARYVNYILESRIYFCYNSFEGKAFPRSFCIPYLKKLCLSR